MSDVAPIHREEFNARLDLLQQIIINGFADLKTDNQLLDARLRAVETDVAVIKAKAEAPPPPPAPKTEASRAQKISFLTMFGTAMAGVGYGIWEVVKFVLSLKSAP